MSNKKKIIVMSSLVALLGATAVFNFVLANTTDTASADNGVTTANYFTTYRSERTTTRNEELVQLDSVIALYEEGDEKYETATAMKMEIVSAMERELVLENMVKSIEPKSTKYHDILCKHEAHKVLDIQCSIFNTEDPILKFSVLS